MFGGLSMSKTRIVVLQLKEIIYTAIFVALGVVLILLLVFMFVGKKGSTSDVSQNHSVEYTAGVYNTSITLSDNVLNLEVVVDQTNINSVRLVNLDEAVATMYPLVQPGLSMLEEQLVNGVSLNQLEYHEDMQYTQMMLVDAIKTALSKATSNASN